MALYVVGHLVAHASSAFLESVLVCRWLGKPEARLTEKRTDWPMKRILRVYAQPLPDETRGRLAALAARDGFSPAGRGFFYHCLGVAQRDAVSRERLASFLNLYGFCRNASLAFALGGGLLLVSAALGAVGVASFDVPERLWLAGAAAGAAVGLFVRYLKFYRHYTAEVYLALLVSSKDSTT